MPRSAAVALGLVALLAAPLLAAPADDLLRLVPPGATVCVVVQDVRGHSKRLAESPFAERFAKSDFARTLMSDDGMKAVADAQKVLAEQLGVTADDLRDDVFGDAVVYAYRPPTDDKGTGEAGVLLLKAGKPERLAALLEKLNAAQVKSGELKEVRAKEHATVAYSERVKPDGRSEFYWAGANGLFAYSGQEAALQGVIEAEAAAAKKPPVPAFAAIRAKLGVEGAAVALMFDPRGMDAEWTAKAKGSTDAGEKAFLTQFGKLWAAVDAAALTVELDRGLDVAAHLSVDPTRAPAELKPLFAKADGASGIWAAVPPDALLAVGGRLDLAKLAEVGASFLSADGLAGVKKVADGLAPVVGRDALPKVVRGLGPEWGGWATPPRADDKGCTPVLTAAVRVKAADSTDDTVADAVMSAVDFVVQMFRVEYNRTHADQLALGDEKRTGGKVRVLKGDGAGGAARLAYAVRGEFFVLASDPAAVEQFDPKASAATPADGLVARFAAGRVAALLKARPKEWANTLAGWTGQKADDLAPQLADLAAVLELLDTVEVRSTADGSKLKLTLHVDFVKPLKK